MKLHLGCGDVKLEEYVNIDLGISHLHPDRVWDLNKPLDYEENSVDEILAIHVFEHLDRPNLETVVASWFYCLKPGGMLLLELPNLEALCKAFLAESTDEVVKWIYGNQEHPGQYHKWGWTPASLADFLRKRGFTKIEIKEPLCRLDMKTFSFRVEATK